MIRALPRSYRRSLLAVFLFAVAPCLRAQSLGVIKPTGREPTLSIGGLLQVQGEFGDRGDARFANDRFYLRRARLNGTGKFLEEFDFRIELDLAGSLGAATGLRAQLTDGYINWNRYPAANLKVGQFKTPYGFEQLYGDPRLYTIERSLANDRLTLSRQIGVQVGGDLADKRLSYAIGTFNGNGVNNSANDDNRFLSVARLSGIPWQGRLGGQSASWSLGADGFSSNDANVSPGSEFGFDSTPSTPDRDNVFAGKRDGWGLDSQLVAGPFELWGEALRVKWKPDSGTPASEIESRGWYLQGSAYVVPERLQLVLKAESFDPRRDQSSDVTATDTVGLNWLLKGQDLKLMVDYLRVRSDVPPRDQNKVLARLQVIF